MNKLLLITALFFIGFNMNAQNFSGQWKGGFIDKSTSRYTWGAEQADYVIDLDVDGTKVTGYSYTYFSSEGKKYFTICRLKGIADKKKKYIEVKETERTKTNIPQNIPNSFQIHKLNWRKEGNNEILEGNWIPAPGQKASNIGFGTTVLTKRQLTEISPLAKKLNSKNTAPINPLSNNNTKIQNTIVGVKKTSLPIAKTNNVKTSMPLVKLKPAVKSPVLNTIKDTSEKIIGTTKVNAPAIKKDIVGFEKRTKNIIQTINVSASSVKLELYDNGEVDGDSISLFYNGQVLISHKKLTEQAIKLEIPVQDDEANELIMYADNLGTLPPNTALLIVTDGNKRYEVRITSDLKKSGSIKFVHTKKNE